MKCEANETAQERLHETRYDEELLSANWNPVISMLRRSCRRTRDILRREQQHLREQDAEALLGRIYTAG
jgi:hypothetical protein